MSGVDDEALQGAALIAGVEYSDAERALMVDTIAAQIELARRRRALRLPDDLAPATRFDPRLPGWKQAPQAGFHPAPLPETPLPDSDEDIAFAPVTALAGWIKSGKLTSTRLTDIYLARIEQHAPDLHCFAEVTASLARSQARAADEALAAGRWLGPLHGIPYGCKDIIDTSGIPTCYGAEPYRGRVPDQDATVVARLATSGAVLLGKTSVGALALGDVWYGGITRNPWNILEGSGGSSAGSAAATAAGLAAFCLGTETLGSIVNPSLRCGTTGLRPTFGRVPRTGAMALAWTLDKIGPICRSVEDTALVLDALLGPDAADPCQIDLPFGYRATAPTTGLRLGYFPTDLHAPDALPLDGTALEAAAALGCELVALERPDLPYDTLMSTLFAEAGASFEHLTLSGDDDRLTRQDDGAWPNSFRRARFLSAVDHIQLDRLRRRVMQVMEGWMSGVDAIIGPPQQMTMSIITNFTGHPALILRSGFRQAPVRPRASLARGTIDRGVEAKDTRLYTVPHSVCLWGRLFDEGTILVLGRALEGRFGVAEKRPPL